MNIYKYSFGVKVSGEGADEHEAWANAKEKLKEMPVPDVFQREGVVETMLNLQCDLCGYAANVRESDMGEWIPEIYLGNIHVGCACPKCSERYCVLDEESGTSSIKIGSLNFIDGSLPYLARQLRTIVTSGD